MHQSGRTARNPRSDLRWREPSRQGERGVALIMALLVLAALAVIAISLGSSTVMNRRMASDDVTSSKARLYAESGVYEACNRIANGLGPDPNAVNAALKVVQILNTTTPGSAGSDTTLLATGQPSGQWLNYGAATKGAGALTIEFRTDPARTMIYRYDKTQNPPIQTSTGAPIYRITSTGTDVNAKRTIVAEVTAVAPMSINVLGALCAGQGVTFGGNAIVCGFSHLAAAPSGTGSVGRTGSGGCNEDPAATPPKWEWSTGAATGIWSAGTVNYSGSAQAFGTPASSDNSSPFPAGPWTVLGMTQSQFYAWAGSPTNSMPGTPSGITYLDNDGTKQNAAGSWSINDGTGFLYADGDLTVQKNWRGLIYVEGDLKMNSTGWVLGAIVCKGAGTIKVNGGATILYSPDAIQQYVSGTASAGGKPTVLSWKEQ